MDLLKEQAALAKADADLVDANERIRRQASLIADLQRDGHDTAAAAELLRTLQSTREAMIAHRTLIVQTIEDIKAGKFRDF
ncbi:hypothetical protein B0G57_10319 [Trinickia symbiotica]|uniref:hypothetical protein n=1 Tax=Trinickia TaxID=2571160 RepID=UPI000D4AA5EA|nr:hypothetical protein [Trinickia symbiotica]PPK45995.1 hypothetical protein B0G57_10319 [Trinickia symbiotica]